MENTKETKDRSERYRTSSEKFIDWLMKQILSVREHSPTDKPP